MSFYGVIGMLPSPNLHFFDAFDAIEKKNPSALFPSIQLGKQFDQAEQEDLAKEENWSLSVVTMMRG